MAKEKENTEELANGFDAQAMLEKNNKAQRTIKYNDRIKVEILNDTRHYKKGQIVTPHRVMGEGLIEQGIAKEVK